MKHVSAREAVEQCLAVAGAFACSNETEERMWCTPNFLPSIDYQRMRDAFSEAMRALSSYKPELDASTPWDGVVFEMDGTRVHAPGVSFYVLTRWLKERNNADDVRNH